MIQGQKSQRGSLQSTMPTNEMLQKSLNETKSIAENNAYVPTVPTHAASRANRKQDASLTSNKASVVMAEENSSQKRTLTYQRSMPHRLNFIAENIKNINLLPMNMSLRHSIFIQILLIYSFTYYNYQITAVNL